MYAPFLHEISASSLCTFTHYQSTTNNTDLPIPLIYTIGEYIGDEYHRPHWAVTFINFPSPQHLAVLRGEVPPLIEKSPNECVLILTGPQYTFSVAHTAALVGNVAAMEEYAKWDPKFGDRLSYGHRNDYQFAVSFAALLGGHPNSISYVCQHSKSIQHFPFNIVYINACLSASPLAVARVKTIFESKATVSPGDEFMGSCMLNNVVAAQELLKSKHFGTSTTHSSPLSFYIEVSNPPVFKGCHAFHFAALCGAVSILRHLPGSPEVLDGEGRTPQHYAAMGGQLQFLRELRDLNVDFNAKDKMEMYPIHYAAMAGHVGCVHFLAMHGADITVKDKKGRGCVFFAAYSGRVDLLRYVLDKCGTGDLAISTHTISPMLIAAEVGMVECVDFMIERGADITLVTNNNQVRSNYDGKYYRGLRMEKYALLSGPKPDSTASLSSSSSDDSEEDDDEDEEDNENNS